MQIHPPTPAHKHARKHISAFPVSIRRINVPSITAYYRPPPPLADGLEKKKKINAEPPKTGSGAPNVASCLHIDFPKGDTADP